MSAGHVLLAPDKFKGSLSAPEVARHLAAGLRRAVPGLDVHEVPVADGGDGTVAAALAAGFRRVPVAATGPTGEPVTTAYAERDGVAVVELADASGLDRLPGGRRDPLGATSFGTGEVIAAALDAGCHTVVLGLGGSACTDGGAGMLQALGVRVVDAYGQDIGRGGGALAHVAAIDTAALHPRVAEAAVVVACDVDNPLTGPAGAAAVYGPQKGADEQQVAALDAALARWAEVLPGGSAARDTPGSGAAGGVGFAALAVLGARLRPGIDYLLDLLDFPRHLAGAALVVTGEGSLDGQTLRGKAPAGVAATARAAGVAVVAVAGRVLLSTAEAAAAGIGSVHALTDLEPDPARCMAEAGPLLERLAAERLAPEIQRLTDDSTPSGRPR